MNSAGGAGNAAIRRRRGQEGMTMVELLMAASISVIITTMILVSWFALSKSYATTVKREKVSDTSRLALTRMGREIRDVEQPPATVYDVAIAVAQPYCIEFYTTFNKSGNQFANVTPRLVMYRLYAVTVPGQGETGQLWRFQDLNNDGAIENVDEDAGSSFNPAERLNGEGAQLLVSNVVNESTPSVSSPTPVFTYIFYNTDGTLGQATLLQTMEARLQIRAVETNLLLDMNPGKSPVYTHLRTTVQLRNTR